MERSIVAYLKACDWDWTRYDSLRVLLLPFFTRGRPFRENPFFHESRGLIVSRYQGCGIQHENATGVPDLSMGRERMGVVIWSLPLEG